MTKFFLFSVIGIVLASHAFAAKRALIYNGPGACTDGCYDAAFQVALEAGYDPVFIGEKALDIQSTSADVKTLFQNAAVWIQPGGKSKTQMTSITETLKNAIDDFVKLGGGYVGFCAGAFSSTGVVGTTNTLGFGFMPGNTIVYPSNNEAEIIPLQWEGKTRQVYWEGGPYLTAIPKGAAELIATYPNGKVAAARSRYGKGRAFVTGLHPEAPQDWRDYYHLTDTDGLDHDLAIEMINWASSAP
jgi:glutamine amidotransferase-like uncharacterized protein